MKQKINLEAAFSQITEYWSPQIAGELNGQHVKLAKLKGEFVWHQHDEADEMFWVVEGQLQLLLPHETIVLNPGELYIVPRGTQHKPVAEEEVKVMLFEPAGTINTGNHQNEFTQKAETWLRDKKG